MDSRVQKKIGLNREAGLVYVPLDADIIPIITRDQLKDITMLYTDHLADCVGISLLHRDNAGELDKIMLFHSNTAHLFQSENHVKTACEKKSFINAVDNSERFIIGLNKFLKDYDSLQKVTVILHKTRKPNAYNPDEDHVMMLIKSVFKNRYPKIEDDSDLLRCNVVNQSGTPFFYVATDGSSGFVKELNEQERLAKNMVDAFVKMLDKRKDDVEFQAVGNVARLKNIISTGMKSESQYPYITLCNEICKELQKPELPPKPSKARNRNLLFKNDSESVYKKFVQACQPIIDLLVYTDVLGCKVDHVSSSKLTK